MFWNAIYTFSAVKKNVYCTEKLYMPISIRSRKTILSKFFISQIQKNNVTVLKSPRKCMIELKLETRDLDFWFHLFPLLLLTYVSHFVVKNYMVQNNINSQIIFLIYGSFIKSLLAYHLFYYFCNDTGIYIASNKIRYTQIIFF